MGGSSYRSESNYKMIMDDYERTDLIPFITYYKEKKKKYKYDERPPANKYENRHEKWRCILILKCIAIFLSFKGFLFHPY